MRRYVLLVALLLPCLSHGVKPTKPTKLDKKVKFAEDDFPTEELVRGNRKPSLPRFDKIDKKLAAPSDYVKPAPHSKVRLSIEETESEDKKALINQLARDKFKPEAVVFTAAHDGLPASTEILFGDTEEYEHKETTKIFSRGHSTLRKRPRRESCTCEEFGRAECELAPSCQPSTRSVGRCEPRPHSCNERRQATCESIAYSGDEGKPDCAWLRPSPSESEGLCVSLAQAQCADLGALACSQPSLREHCAYKMKPEDVCEAADEPATFRSCLTHCHAKSDFDGLQEDPDLDLSDCRDDSACSSLLRCYHHALAARHCQGADCLAYCQHTLPPSGTESPETRLVRRWAQALQLPGSCINTCLSGENLCELSERYQRARRILFGQDHRVPIGCTQMDEDEITLRAIGQIRFDNNNDGFIDFDTEPSFCSGMMIGPRHVLTAAHCLIFNFTNATFNHNAGWCPHHQCHRNCSKGWFPMKHSNIPHEYFSLPPWEAHEYDYVLITLFDQPNDTDYISFGFDDDVFEWQYSMEFRAYHHDISDHDAVSTAWGNGVAGNFSHGARSFRHWYDATYGSSGGMLVRADMDQYTNWSWSFDHLFQIMGMHVGGACDNHSLHGEWCSGYYLGQNMTLDPYYHGYNLAVAFNSLRYDRICEWINLSFVCDPQYVGG